MKLVYHLSPPLGYKLLQHGDFVFVFALELQDSQNELMQEHMCISPSVCLTLGEGQEVQKKDRAFVFCRLAQASLVAEG